MWTYSIYQALHQTTEVMTISRYTMTLAEMLQRYSPSTNAFSLEQIAALVKNSEANIFPYPYPIWDEDYRSVLNCKICTHYLYREIGFDTPARFIFELSNKLNEIMPYYNQLYKTQLEGIQALVDMDLYEEYIGEGATHDVSKDTSTEDAQTEGDRSKHDMSEETNYANTTYGKNTRHTKSGDDTLQKEYGKSQTTTYNNVQDTATYNSQNATEYDSQDKKTGQDINRFSNTPQGALIGILSDRYLTNATVDDIDETTAKTGTDTAKHTGNDTNVRTGSQTVADSGKDTDVTTYDTTDDTQDSGEDKTDGGNTGNVWTTEGYLDKKLGTTTSNKDASGTKNDSYFKHTWGRTGSKDIVEEVMQLRDAIINIDMMVIEELNDLFMGLY